MKGNNEPPRYSALSRYIILMIILMFVLPSVFFLAVSGTLLFIPLAWNNTQLVVASSVLLLCHSHGISRAVSGRSFAFLRINYHMFSYVFFCLVPALQYHSHTLLPYSVGITFTQADNLRALSLLIVAVASFEASSVLATHFTAKNSVRYFWTRFSNPQAIIFATFILVGLAIASFVVFVRDLSVLLSDRWSMSQTMLERQGTAGYLIIIALVRTPSFAALYYLVYLYVTDPGMKRRVLYLYAVITVFPVFLIANFPPAVDRISLGSMAFAIAIIYLAFRAREKNLWLFCLNAVALLVIFPMMNILRFIYSFKIDLSWSKLILDSYVSAQFDAYQMLMAVLRYVDISGHTYGWQLFSSLLFFVPRAIFPAKGISIGAMVGESLGFSFVNISSPLISELYMDFYIPGIMVGFAAIGYVATRLEHKFNHMQVDPHGLLMIAFLSGWQAILLRGSMFTALTYLTPTILLIWSIKTMVKK